MAQACSTSVTGTPIDVRGGAQRVGLRTGLQQGVTGQPEQPAAALGLGHVVDGEAEAGQVFEQARARPGISDSGGLNGLEVQGIDHRPSVPVVTRIRVKCL